MKQFQYDNAELFEAFIKSTQYVVRLKTQQDVWEHLGKFITTYFPADWVAFAGRDPADGISIHQRSPAAHISGQQILTDEVRTLITDVLDSGFLASHLIAAPEPVMTAFLPIAVENRQEKVMLIGHDTTAPLSKELLNIYLAIAGLAGATFERLKNERDLIEHRAELEGRVKERTAELARSNNDLEQFAYIASHDLQEPLRAVAGFMGFLKNEFATSLDARAREYIDLSIEGAARMQALIRDLLEFSRVGTQGRKPALTNLSDTIEGAKKNLFAAIDEANATISYEKMPTILVDAGQITQLFQNLIGNAIKFRGSLRPDVVIGARYENKVWEMSVRDNGIGIDKEHVERVFQLFQRLHTRSQYPGTGIGLAVCKKIVERHGGSIWVESTPGQGATFYFTIPEKPDGA